MMSLSEYKLKFLLVVAFQIVTHNYVLCQISAFDTLLPASPSYKKSIFHKIVMGNHYRKIWSTPVPVQIFNKDSIQGGLRFTKAGGDLQTISLKFHDSSGHHYTFRLIDKDQSKFLSPFWRNTIAGKITNDLTSALFPYAPMVIDTLIQSVTIHSELIGLYALPTDTSYTKYLQNIKGRLGFLYRSYKPINSQVLSTEEFLEMRFKSPTPIDTLRFLEQRLFDFIIGDFDRHRDQWEWELQKANQGQYFIPISKDHDMAFSKFREGMIPFLLTKAQPIMQQYNGMYKLKSLAKVGNYLDHLLLPGTTANNFISTAIKIQNQFTDSVLQTATRKLPDTIYKLAGTELLQNLKSRRNNLTDAARAYYKLIHKKITIAGTDDNEKVIITIVNLKEVKIEMFHHGMILLSKGYTYPITKEINIYSLGGTDKIKLSGRGKNKIRINIYGGLQEDHYHQYELTKISNVHIYDTKKGNKIALHKKIKKHLKRKSTKYTFEREGF
jgi:hypothetical protein